MTKNLKSGKFLMTALMCYPMLGLLDDLRTFRIDMPGPEISGFADVMQRIAASRISGMGTTTALPLLVIPDWFFMRNAGFPYRST